MYIQTNVRRVNNRVPAPAAPSNIMIYTLIVNKEMGLLRPHLLEYTLKKD
jgi:hypothetical protein